MTTGPDHTRLVRASRIEQGETMEHQLPNRRLLPAFVAAAEFKTKAPTPRNEWLWPMPAFMLTAAVCQPTACEGRRKCWPEEEMTTKYACYCPLIFDQTFHWNVSWEQNSLPTTRETDLRKL